MAKVFLYKKTGHSKKIEKSSIDMLRVLKAKMSSKEAEIKKKVEVSNVDVISNPEGNENDIKNVENSSIALDTNQGNISNQNVQVVQVV